MNTIQFLKEQGVEKAREVVEGAPDGATHYRVFSCSTGYTKNISISECYIWYRSAWQECEWPSKIFTSSNLQTIAELKQIVESLDLLKSNGGYEEAKDTFDFAIKHGMNDLTEFGSRLKQAIADYEQLFGNTETLELETLRDCDTSPNCKKFDERVNSNETN